MSSIITRQLKLEQAKRYKSILEDENSNLYLAIGKSDPWPNDTEPTTAVDTIEQDFERWNNMISLKKINDISHGIQKHDWDTSGDTVYFEYSHDDSDLYYHPTSQDIVDAGSDYTPGAFYTVTDEYHVYKCISNNGMSKSTVKPTGTSTSIIETADGYKWKYMYTVTTPDALKYKTSDFIPVKTLTSDDGSAQWDVQQAAVDGAVEHISVTDAGSGYNSVHSGTAQSGGSNTITLASGASGVNDHYNGCTVFIDDGQNAGQYRLITDYDGSTKLATLSAVWNSSIAPDSSSVYVVVPTVTISGGTGSGLTARAYTDGGEITKIEPITKGSGYRFSGSISISITGGGGSGAEARAIISPKNGHGKDPVTELGGFYSITSVTLQHNDNDFITRNDYRIINLVAGVLNYGTSTLSTANTLSASKVLNCETLVDSFDEDEIIEGSTSGATAVVIESTEDSDANTASIKYYQNNATGFTQFQVGETITGQTSGATAEIDTKGNPEISPYEGKILRLEHRRPLMRSVGQYEQIVIVIQH